MWVPCIHVHICIVYVYVCMCVWWWFRGDFFMTLETLITPVYPPQLQVHSDNTWVTTLSVTQLMNFVMDRFPVNF